MHPNVESAEAMTAMLCWLAEKKGQLTGVTQSTLEKKLCHFLFAYQ
jgi:hypothetical protein